MSIHVVRKISDDAQFKRPACVACSKAKRRCTKQAPACHRCRTKRIRCDYPSSRVLLSPPLATSSTSEETSQVDLGAVFGLGDATEDSDATADQIAADGIDRFGAKFLESPWFLSASGWEIDKSCSNADNSIAYMDSGLDFFVDQLRLWLDQWTTDNHCPFIHARLYGDELPCPLQNAYAAWLTYRSPGAIKKRRIALQMGIDWSRNIVEEQSIYDGLGKESIKTLHHLCRTQALIVFQLMGLFDGDIRARAQAEDTSRTVLKWAEGLIQSAVADVTAQHHPGRSDQIVPGPMALRSDGSLDSTWKAWALSESIRRTWIVANLLEAAFLIQKQGFAICPGSIGFTGKSGMWNASSPHEWLRSVQAKTTTNLVVFCRGLDKLLTNGKPPDVDEFSQALLTYGCGREAVVDWLASQV
ncbi:unnamed protein product [Clonostachys rhizophaga]|uniref:Zn(2)-C6 fungal-type domain-containing protein n=1 Tax=Clonostachys rhizophaga TaxID=160324 RepID=A0A9N9V3F0_9HYPO|nr:unnamed protein product [Clonostachys rhizophaga]